MGIRWNALKSERLKRVRGVSFEEIVKARMIGIENNPGRAGQKMILFEYRGYVWVTPCIVKGDDIFLKTLYPSRKYHKMFLEGRL